LNYLIGGFGGGGGGIGMPPSSPPAWVVKLLPVSALMVSSAVQEIIETVNSIKAEKQNNFFIGMFVKIRHEKCCPHLQE